MLTSVALPAYSNAIANGDFSSGNASFTSQYNYNAGDVQSAGAYTVASDPHAVHPGASTYGDHTTGTGLMFMANGSTSGGRTLWGQAVAVTPGTDYTFAGWIASWGSNGFNIDPSPAALLIYINDSRVGSFVNAPAADGQWIQFTEVWSSAAFSQADIRIIDANTASYGNDFSLDDLSFTASVPEPTTLALVGAALFGVVATRRRRATNPYLEL